MNYVLGSVKVSDFTQNTELQNSYQLDSWWIACPGSSFWMLWRTHTLLLFSIVTSFIAKGIYLKETYSGFEPESPVHLRTWTWKAVNIRFVWLPDGGHIRGGADKSLARPGRKQATANKLGIYSTYSPRSSIHFLALCSNFCKPLKKKIIRLSVQPVLRGSNDFRVGRKMATFQLFFFSVQGTGGSPTGPDPENRPFSSGLQVPGEPGHCRARTRQLG